MSIIAGTLACTLSNCLAFTSCSLVDFFDSFSLKSFDGSNWNGVIRGHFFDDSYVIDETKKTITYNNSVGIKFENLVIPNYVTYKHKTYKVLLGPKCFQNNLYLAGSLELNDFIDEIPDKCCEGCHNLSKLIFHKAPKAIGDFAFTSTALQEIVVKTSVGESHDWAVDVRTIGQMAFYMSWISGDLVFGKYLTHLGDYAFGDCYAIKSVDLSYSFNIHEISKGAFEGCTSLSIAYFPPFLSVVNESAFQMCTALTKVVLPRDNMRLDFKDSAFYACLGLRSFSRNFQINHIGDRCFYQNGMLEARLWESNYCLQTIGADAFSECSFASVSFDPAHIEDVGDYAFAYCPNLCCIDLSKYDVEVGVPTWSGKNIFLDAYPVGTIYMAESALFDEHWKNFFLRNNIEISQDKWRIIKVEPEPDEK